MKRKDLMRQLADIASTQNEMMATKEGGNHTKVTIGKHVTYVPRHKEINDDLCKDIIKQAKGEK